MYALMLRYQDTPMDLADASLVATAETLNQTNLYPGQRFLRVPPAWDRSV